MAGRMIDQTIARLRFVLVQVRTKRDDLRAQERQFVAQLRRLPHQVLHGPLAVDVALGAMAEVEERLAAVRANLRRLDDLEGWLNQDLQAHQLTLQVEEARASLAALQDRAADEGLSPSEEEEVQRLQVFIVETSRRAGDLIARGG